LVFCDLDKNAIRNYYLDSLGFLTTKQLKFIDGRLNGLFHDFDRETRGSIRHVSDWDWKVPRQRDNFSCGIFTFLYAKALTDLKSETDPAERLAKIKPKLLSYLGLDSETVKLLMEEDDPVTIHPDDLNQLRSDLAVQLKKQLDLFPPVPATPEIPSTPPQTAKAPAKNLPRKDIPKVAEKQKFVLKKVMQDGLQGKLRRLSPN